MSDQLIVTVFGWPGSLSNLTSKNRRIFPPLFGTVLRPRMVYSFCPSDTLTGGTLKTIYIYMSDYFLKWSGISYMECHGIPVFYGNVLLYAMICHGNCIWYSRFYIPIFIHCNKYILIPSLLRWWLNRSIGMAGRLSGQKTSRGCYQWHAHIYTYIYI